jgi:prevent-host-death family protein
MIMTMIMVNIHEAKAKLSEYLEAAERGERVVICKRNQPVAELKPIAAPIANTPRPFGLAKGTLTVPASFFDPLPDDMLNAFYGDPPARATRVAEKPDTPYGANDHEPRKPRRR